MYQSENRERGRVEPRSLASHVADLGDELYALVRKEVELAKVELSEKVEQAQKGTTALASGGAVLYAGFFFILLAITFGLAAAMPLWLAALIVGAVVAIAGGVMLANGRKRLRSENLAPRRTAATLRDTRDLTRGELQ